MVYYYIRTSYEQKLFAALLQEDSVVELSSRARTTDFDECSSLPCFDETCVEPSVCPVDYPSSECSTLGFLQCGNGSCIPHVAVDDYACSCDKGTTGDRCGTDVDECASSPCVSDGVGTKSGSECALTCCLVRFGSLCGHMRMHCWVDWRGLHKGRR